jgi:ABC-type multidrug transport system ATPase subunit
MLADSVIELKEVTKIYKKTAAADKVSFEVRAGQVFGIIGPNGAGKTTTLSMILGLVKPTSGSISILGHTDPEQARKFIGATLETSGFYPEFSAFKNLKITALARGEDLNSIDEVLDIAGLTDRKKDSSKTYSFGMKQRLAIAQALIGNRQIIILDEPTNGLDPRGIIEVREIIHKLKHQGKTVIVASHMLGEMEKVCTDVAIFNKGKVVWTGELKNILSQYDSLEDAFMQLTHK